MAEQISQDERVFWTELVAERQRAEAACQSFAAFLARKYALGAGDRVTSDGRIERVAVGTNGQGKTFDAAAQTLLERIEAAAK